MSTEDILFEETSGASGSIGTILLNRPKALNAITTDMCDQLSQQLLQWQHNDAIKAVIIKGAGERAFCAGGDVRALYAMRDSVAQQSTPFFSHEYQMNTHLYHFPKPYISLLDGITMGGGAGVSIHGSHRVATEKFVFAMPETSIGFFPDIGAGHFLTRLSGKIGWYLGLTGLSIKADDALALGLINAIVPSDCLMELETALLETEFQSKDHHVVSQIIEQFASAPGTATLNAHYNTINHCFGKDTVEEVILTLAKDTAEFSQSTQKTLLQRSPTSLKVTFEQLKRAQTMCFDDEIKMELHIAQHFLTGHDFFEGIRAALVDKDQQPQWQPNQLNAVSAADILAYFD